MWVRVFDKGTNQYFKSEVYAKFNIGWFEKYLVKVPSKQGNFLKLIDFLDKSAPGPGYPVNINLISINNNEDWIIKKDQELSEFQSILPDIKFDFFWGYSWIIENIKLVGNLLRGENVPCTEIYNQMKCVNTKKSGWNYVGKDEDVDILFKGFGGFHDSVLKDLHYISGAHGSENAIMPMDTIRRVTMIFENDNGCSLEMVFEGVTALNLRPAPDGYDSVIFDATIIIKEETVFFCNAQLEKEEYPEGCTCIKAYGLRWRMR